MKPSPTARWRPNIPAFFLLVLCLILCVALIVVGVSYHGYKREAEEALLAVPAIAPVSPAAADASLFSKAELEKRAKTYSGYLEFLQSFYEDKIVYRDEGNVLRFDAIDPTLQRNTYDWSSLTKSGDRRAYEDAEFTSRFGIDVSKFQGAIDWPRVKADGVDFALLRIGYRGYSGDGKLMQDETFEANFQGARDAGVDVGVYFFTQAVTPEEAVEEAEQVLEWLDGSPLEYPIALDVEYAAADARAKGLTAAELTDSIIAFCNSVEQAGYTPMVYSNLQWYLSKMEYARLEPYEKWLAQTYTIAPFFPYQFAIWQYTFTGRVDGITGDVDLNLHIIPRSGAQE